MPDEVIQKIIEGTVQEYNRLLASYYPAHGSTGFTEANQVARFCMAASSLYDDAQYWLEAPLPGSRHIDAAIFIPEHEAALFVEAKRFSQPGQKKKELFEDIRRLLDSRNRDYILKNHARRGAFKRHFIVVLADVWLETEAKKSIPGWWESEDNTPDKSFAASILRECEHAHWPPKNQKVRCVSQAKDACVRDNYRLLFGYYEVPAQLV